MKHSKATRKKMSDARKAYWANKKSEKLLSQFTRANPKEWASRRSLVGTVLNFFGL